MLNKTVKKASGSYFKKEGIPTRELLFHFSRNPMWNTSEIGRD